MFSSSAGWREHPSEACFKRSGSALLNCCIRCRTISAARGLEGLAIIAVRQEEGWESPLGAASAEENIHVSVLAGETKDSASEHRSDPSFKGVL